MKDQMDGMTNGSMPTHATNPEMSGNELLEFMPGEDLSSSISGAMESSSPEGMDMMGSEELDLMPGEAMSSSISEDMQEISTAEKTVKKDFQAFEMTGTWRLSLSQITINHESEK